VFLRGMVVERVDERGLRHGRRSLAAARAAADRAQRHRHGGARCKIHVLGGEGWIDDFGGVFRTHEAYDPKRNAWARLARMPTPRHGFAAATIGDKIYAVSGVNNAGGAGTLSVVNVNEIYEP
jgi:N-acetylneuraminic acid mutarotase